MPLKRSWIESANAPDTEFPLNNLPYGVYSPGENDRPRCGVAIGDFILDMRAAEQCGLIELRDGPLLDVPCWNGFMEKGIGVWASLRDQLTALLVEGARDRRLIRPLLTPMASAEMHLPFVLSEYTDFYSSRDHAFNVGTMFRGPDNALPPNWLHMPIGYNGRASSVVVSGTGIRRPWGQVKSPQGSHPDFQPSRRLDFELEMGVVVGRSSQGMLTVPQADAMIFGYVLLNDWSARDIQRWEAVPLGPFQSKATATSISPWIVPQAALESFRVRAPSREVELPAYLKDQGPMHFDIELTATLTPSGGRAHRITRTNYRNMYYSAAQQLAHHASCGCPMSVGDLLGSGTVSGPERGQRGCMLELAWGGREPLDLDGARRDFLEDGDRLTLSGTAYGNGYKIGFGDCTGVILPAQERPFQE